MSIEVSGPDGSSFSFPDGTPHETIIGALSKHYGSAAPKLIPVEGNLFAQRSRDISKLSDDDLKRLYAGQNPHRGATKIVEFEGQRHEFPSDFSQEDIAAALSSSPARIQPTEQERAGLGASKALEGIIGLGAFVPQAGAAISAFAHPLTGVGAEGETIGERYSKNLERERALSAQAEQNRAQSGNGCIAND